MGDYVLSCKLSKYFVAALFILPTLQAGVISTTGNASFIASRTSARAGDYESNTITQVFFERYLLLGSSLTVDNTATGAYPPNGVATGSIAAGTEIESYYLDFDPVGTGTSLICPAAPSPSIRILSV